MAAIVRRRLPVAVVLFLAVAVWAGPSVNRSFFGKVAIHGYDPVAYFTEHQPVKGEKSFTTNWHDANWYFASAANLALFNAEPEKYAPQYGGYCAWAVAHNDTADIDPEAWKIVAGKLYLNYSAEIQAKWAKDIPTLIRQADANWPALSD